MKQDALFTDIDSKDKNEWDLSHGLVIKIIQTPRKKAVLYRHDNFVKSAYLSDKVAKRLFVLDAVDQGANKTILATALQMSRQSIHNYEETRKYFGMEGLVHAYSPRGSKNPRAQRAAHLEKLPQGNKARQLEEIRRQSDEQRESRQSHITFSFEDKGEAERVEQAEQPYFEEHNWEPSRYAGVFAYLTVLITECKWLRLIQGYFGGLYKIFMVFLLMSARNIRSIEQLKNINSREAGTILGIKRLPAKPLVWEWFYSAAEKQKAQSLVSDYFYYQVRAGAVGIWLWFTDGHLLPYTGKERVRYAYNTQRRMPEPGQTNMVTCDGSGRIVDFEIQEGKGDLRLHILALAAKWKDKVSNLPVMVFDREGRGAGFFSGLVREKVPFVTWEMGVDSKKLWEIEDGRFSQGFEFCGKEYAILEEEKQFVYEPEEDAESEKHEFTLRRIYIWNKTSKRRTSGLAWDGNMGMSAKDCAVAILSRWGASENTFKHINDRHPLHYRPGFKLTVSENQEIGNPAIKEKTKQIKQSEKIQNKLYKKLANTKESLTQDGKPRQNSATEQLKKAIQIEEDNLKRLKEEKSKLPAKVNVSQLENYKSFKKIDNEGKNLFDFVTTSIWNARKQMVDWLQPFFNQENELIDLFYAITDCQGWIKSTPKEVVVRLEPLEQPKRRQAQEQLCRKLTTLGAKTPLGKWLVIEVGQSPFGKCPKK